MRLKPSESIGSWSRRILIGLFLLLSLWETPCNALSTRLSVFHRMRWQRHQSANALREQYRPKARPIHHYGLRKTILMSSSSSADSVPIPNNDETPTDTELLPTASKSLHPKAGDLVRYFDLDGGKSDGQVLVGKISFIQRDLSKKKSGWILELTELEDVGDGYYAEYGARQRLSKKTLRDLADVSPLTASFVRREAAFRIPRDMVTGFPKVRAEQYDWQDYSGPAMVLDPAAIELDGRMYGELKAKILRSAALTGLVGTILADLVKGPEIAAIYGAGVLASLLYLLLLSLKTDTVASERDRMGSKIANFRFVMPVVLIAGVALFNTVRGMDNPVPDPGPFKTVTAEQFAASMVGFLTYRVPLFVIQLRDGFAPGPDNESSGGGFVLPGSAGVAVQMMQGTRRSDDETAKITAGSSVVTDPVATILLVSGPQVSGRTELVQKLIEQGQGRFVAAPRIDRVTDPVTFERLERRNEFLTIDSTGRYGMTKQELIKAATEVGPDAVVVVDAEVSLTQQLTKVAGLRLIGVWVGLKSVNDFEQRLSSAVDAGQILIPEGETRDSVVRGRIRDIVKEIEFGISSGVFEFTILNVDEDQSLKELRAASEYCFA